MKAPGWTEDDQWINPIRTATRRPFLGEIIFPENQFSEAAAEANAALGRFYSPHRDDTEAIEALDNFMTIGDHRLLIIEGAVGIGKTWFVRFTTQIRKHRHSGRCGVIDMIRADPDNPATTIFSQVPLIVDGFLAAVGTSTDTLLNRTVEIAFRSRKGMGAHEVLEDVHKYEIAKEVDRMQMEVGAFGEPASRLRLRALESLPPNESGVIPNLYLVLDNLDRLEQRHQEAMIGTSISILSNSRVRLILPLRSTSQFLLNQYSNLSQFSPLKCKLSRLDVKSVVKPRFVVHRDGARFGSAEAVADNDRTYTFPQLYEKIVNGTGFAVLEAIGRVNTRRLIDCLDRLLVSNHLRGLKNIGHIEEVVQALMLGQGKVSDETAVILDLFRPPKARVKTHASLVYYRVAERAHKQNEVMFSDLESTDFFKALGYDMTDVWEAIVALLGSGVLESAEGHDVDSITRELRPSRIGEIRATPLCALYFQRLLQTEWYYNGVRRSIAHFAPEEYVQYDQKRGYPFLTPKGLYAYLKDAEEREAASLARWANDGNKQISGEKQLSRPSDKFFKYLKSIGKPIDRQRQWGSQTPRKESRDDG